MKGESSDKSAHRDPATYLSNTGDVINVAEHHRPEVWLKRTHWCGL